MARKYTKQGLAGLLLGAIGMLCALVVTVGPAGAYGTIVRTIAGSGNPPPLPSGTVVVENLSQVARAASSATAKSKVYVLSYVMAKGMPKVAVSKAAAAGRCQVIGDGTKVPGFWNSGKDVHGRIFWFWDTRTTTVCRFGSVWRKVGPHNCGNLIRFQKPKTHVVKGIIVLVRSFGRFHATVSVNASATASGSCGSASASAHASATVSGSTRAMARGNARLLASVRATVSATATATASVQCGTTPTVTVTTPGGTTTVTTPTTTTVTTQTTTTQTTTTQTTTTAPPPVSCSLFVPLEGKSSDPYTANASVTDISGGTVTSVFWNWGDGSSGTVSGTSASHTYPKPAPGPAGFVQYTISATAHFSDGRSANCGSAPFNVPIPSPYTTTSSTTTGPPPPPGG